MGQACVVAVSGFRARAGEFWRTLMVIVFGRRGGGHSFAFPKCQQPRLARLGGSITAREGSAGRLHHGTPGRSGRRGAAR